MGALEDLQKALMAAAHTSDKAAHANLDARSADRDAKLAEKLFGPIAKGIINEDLAKRTEGENVAQSTAPAGGGGLDDMQPLPTKVDGGMDMNALNNLTPSTAPPVVPTPTEKQKPGYLATTRQQRVPGAVWMKRTRDVTSYTKDEASVDRASTGLAAELDSIASGSVRSGDSYKNAVESARATLGPFFPEAMAEAKSKALELRRTRLMGEMKAQKEYQMSLVGQGAPPEIVGRLGKAYRAGPEVLASEIQATGWKPKAKEADLLAAQIQREKLHKIERENRIGQREEETWWQTENLRLEREGLSGGVGYRLSEEQAGWTKPQVDDKLTKLLAGGVGSEAAGMLPGLQKAKLALDDEAVFAKDGNIITGDSSFMVSGEDIIIAFAEADGRRPRRAPITAAQKKRGYGVEAHGKDIDQDATMAFRRARAKWLVDTIPGLESYGTQPMPDGTVNFSWEEDQGNRNTPFIMHLQDIAKKHEEIELHYGRELNQYTFGNRELIRAARGKVEIAKPETAPTTKPESQAEKEAVAALPPGASETQKAGTREGVRQVEEMGRTGRFVKEGLMEIPRTFQQTGEGLMGLGAGLIQSTKEAAERKAARDKAIIETMRKRAK